MLEYGWRSREERREGCIRDYKGVDHRSFPFRLADYKNSFRLTRLRDSEETYISVNTKIVKYKYSFFRWRRCMELCKQLAKLCVFKTHYYLRNKISGPFFECFFIKKKIFIVKFLLQKNVAIISWKKCFLFLNYIKTCVLSVYNIHGIRRVIH